MSITLIYSLFKSIRQLSGVGEKRFEAYKRLGLSSIRDLFYHFPVDKIDRRNEPKLSSIRDQQIISQVVRVDSIQTPAFKSNKSPTKILCSNDTGHITLVYFNVKGDFINANFNIGKNIAITGKVTYNYGNLDMVHPDIITDAANINTIKRLEPIYPLTYTLTSRYLAATIAYALRGALNLPEWLDDKLLAEKGWLPWKTSLEIMHFQHQDKMGLYEKARERLAYDEMLAQQICLQIARSKIKVPRKDKINFAGELVNRYLKTLPFELTESQKKVIQEITEDQKSDKRMFRLLQGDVGSGKTIVAFCAMLNYVEAGKQAALMVPTEILAKQHFKKIQEIADQLNITTALLVSAIKDSEKNKVLEKLESGEISLVIGTHALFQDRIKFANLGFVAIDEQHRFGVEQRLSLVDKGNNVDYLMMTATPIPRTLTMVAHGDIDVSVIDEKPQCRQQIKTSIVKEDKIDSVLDGISRMLAKGDKVYWVCPLVDTSEKLTLANVTTRYEFLKKIFPNKVAIVHGQMPMSEREDNMQKFISGEYNILVATTVIEVGVDVPDATVIVIENAERFGLSQLHQLRGRVGRSDKESFCILLAGKAVSYIGFTRLSALKSTNDGFQLAEKDLEFRGGGELLGTKQSGLPTFRAYDLLKHKDLIPLARQEAQQLMQIDPSLTSERAQKLKLLLHLFEMDKCLSYVETLRDVSKAV